MIAWFFVRTVRGQMLSLWVGERVLRFLRQPSNTGTKP